MRIANAATDCWRRLASGPASRLPGDRLSILLIWLALVVVSLFIDPNHEAASTLQLLYQATSNVAVGAFVGIYLLDRFTLNGVAPFTLLSGSALLSSTLFNEALIERYVFATGPINGEGVYYGLLDASTTAALFLVLHLVRDFSRRGRERAPRADSRAITNAEDDRLYVRVAGDTHRISAADVIYMKAEKDFTHIVGVSRTWFASESLKDLLERSARFGIVRVHKSFAVNLNRADRLSSTEVGLGERRVPVGRKYQASVAQVWYG